MKQSMCHYPSHQKPLYEEERSIRDMAELRIVAPWGVDSVAMDVEKKWRIM